MRDRPIVVLGGSGLLGRALVRLLQQTDTPHRAPPRAELDLRNLEGLETALVVGQPAAVINAAAYSDVARAERADQQEAVWSLNLEAPRELARICARREISLIHLSTDYVFDGRLRRPYLETDAVAPLQAYGRSKLEGEHAVAQAHPGALVVRVSTLFGPSGRNRPHYVDAILRQAARQERIEVVGPPVASPTYTPDLARALLELQRIGARGLVHFTNSGACSRLELARETIRAAGLAGRVTVVERPAPQPSLARPEYAVLDGSRYRAWTGREPRSWQAALAAYVRNRGPRGAGGGARA